MNYVACTSKQEVQEVISQCIAEGFHAYWLQLSIASFEVCYW